MEEEEWNNKGGPGAGPGSGVWLGINGYPAPRAPRPLSLHSSVSPALLSSLILLVSAPALAARRGRQTEAMLTLLVLTAAVLLGAAPRSDAIVIYTGWERHALVGSDVRLSCSFFSWRWTSEDVTFSWSYRPDGARDSISIFHYTGGAPYVDNKGPFRERLEFVGNPARRDGSILIRNLDFNDNGTFTCDAKNPPDIVGRPSSVRLLVVEKIPIQAGVITGAIIGVVLGLLILVVAIYYLMRFLVARRVFNLSVSKHGKKGKGKEGSQQRQAGPSK
ncbi:myelin protein P0 isoform X3 [Astyanax mexicanus]|uniref:myelin protein P0 isoform X3 n=1 Tax=Astyanax mexicanus TaxID=7994 RepID=UPI0020CAC861|nr:myelin protein P0 isoform X3 [Astyanax mexicanus]